MKLYRKACLSLSFILLFSLAGCNKSNKSETQKLSTQKSQGSEKAPEQLKTIEEGIEKIFKALDGPVGMSIEDKESKGSKKEEKGGQEKGTQKSSGKKQDEGSKGQGDSDSGDSGDSEKSDKQSGSSDKSKSESGDQKQQKQQQQPQQQTKTDPWQEVSKSIQELHTNWDEYAPKSMKDGATKELTDQFGNALNNLTMVSMKKNNVDTMIATNQLYAYIPDFYYLYKTEVSPEIKKVKYYARDCIISAMKLNWFQTDSDIKNLKASFTIFKRSLEDEMKEKGTKIENSIYELEKVEKERNKELTDIKGRLVLKGTMSLEKELGESGKKSGGSK